MSSREPEVTKPNSAHNLSKQVVLPIILIVVLLGLISAGIYFYLQLQQTRREIDALRNPTGYAEENADGVSQVIDQLSNHIILPDEDPVVYTINDVENAREVYGDFFAVAQNGDVLIIYSNRAIIFRPEVDRIVNIGPVIYQ